MAAPSGLIPRVVRFLVTKVGKKSGGRILGLLILPGNHRLAQYDDDFTEIEKAQHRCGNNRNYIKTDK